MRYLKFVFILIFAVILAACTTIKIQTEYVIVTATPIATPPIPTNTSIPTLTPTPITQLVIAVQDIPAGSQIQADMVDLIEFPAIYAPQTGFTRIENVIGSYALTSLSAGEFVTIRRIRDQQWSSPWTPIKTVFARQDIAAGETLEPSMYYYAFVVLYHLEDMGINPDDVFDASQETTTGWVARSDIHAYELILANMVSPID